MQVTGDETQSLRMEVPGPPVAASRTMILLDPDLDTNPHPKTPVRSGKRAFAATATPRNQRIPSLQALVRFLREAQGALKLRGEVSILLTSDKTMRRLNRQFRNRDKTTDVLSFPAEIQGPERIAGDLAISLPAARRQSEERGHALGVEMRVLILHGLLHLAGYDHETDDGEMARREQRLRAKLGLPHGLIERSVRA